MKKQLFLTGMLLVGGISLASANHHQSEKSPKASGTADVTPPTVPDAGPTATPPSSNTLQFGWYASSDNVGVTGYNVYKNGVYIGTTTSTIYTIKTGLSPSTTYTFTVKAKDAAGNLSAASKGIKLTTTSVFQGYCSITSNDPSGPKFINFKYGGAVKVNNTSTFNAGFRDYTALIGSMGTQGTYTMSSSTLNDKRNYEVYIDFNNNKVFENNEVFKMKTTANSGVTTVTGSIVIPNIPMTQTRMRVRLSGTDEAPGNHSCTNVKTGQVADYTVYIYGSDDRIVVNPKDLSSETDKLKIPTSTDIKVYPNPVKDVLTISNMDSEEYKIFNMEGKQISSGKLVRGSANVSSLVKGVYMIQIGKVSKRFIKD
ncbi:GEVED domain-containing protein [Chryseobacterium sediminis]|uniref:T9SS type A sorting domain-containing protein n=1 Tax=Chryseobacterium sediminis TaxID=1679494 RepID=A0A5B2UAB2_9FLAO|nr:GEVED domain-containing protein [Chryseobacterium sediminis]KAA2223195.1 T9SS type A sorting domain-containing protein [Chryseobacterium sediminis]